MLVIKVSFQG